MQLTVLGSGTFQPTPTRGFSGYFVKVKDTNILLDAGSGQLRQLARIGITADDIDIIFLSHYHIDHTAEIAPILFAKRHSLKVPKKHLSIYGPPELETLFNGLVQLYADSVEPDGYQLSLFEYSDSEIELNGFRVRVLPVQHTENSFGIRIEENNGAVLAYSGDSDFCENLITLCKNSDLAVIECSFPNEYKQPGHLTPREVGHIADKAGCKKVLLTHFYPITEKTNIIQDCAAYYKGTVLIAEELMPMLITK